MLTDQGRSWPVFFVLVSMMHVEDKQQNMSRYRFLRTGVRFSWAASVHRWCTYFGKKSFELHHRMLV